MSKRDEVRDFINRQARCALNELIGEMGNREQAEVIRTNRDYIANKLGWHIAEQYRFLELSDIMEWKRTRVRR